MVRVMYGYVMVMFRVMVRVRVRFKGLGFRVMG